MPFAELNIGGKESVTALVEKMNRKIDELTEKNRKLAEESKKGFDETASSAERVAAMVDRMNASLGHAAGSVTNLYGGVSRVKHSVNEMSDAWLNYHSAQGKAGAATAEAQSGMIKMVDSVGSASAGTSLLTAQITGQLGPLAALGAGYLSAQGALNLLNNETQRQRDLQDKGKTVVDSIAAAQSTAIRNMPAGYTQEKMDETVKNLSTTGLTQERLYSALADKNVRRRTANLTQDQLGEAMGEAAKWASQTQEGFTGSLGGISELMSSEGMTAKQAAAFLNRVGNESGSGFDEAANQMVPSLLKSKAYGGNLNDIGALGAAIDSDPRFAAERGPRQAALAARTLAEKLHEAYPTSTTYETVNGRRKVKSPGTKRADDPESIIEWLQQNPKEAEKFIANAHFNTDDEGIITDILHSGTGAANRLARNRAEARGPDTSAARINAINAPPEQTVAKLGRFADVKTESNILGDMYRAAEGEIKSLAQDTTSRLPLVQRGIQGITTLVNQAADQMHGGEQKGNLSAAGASDQAALGNELARLNNLAKGGKATAEDLRQIQVLESILLGITALVGMGRAPTTPNKHNE
jgi:ribosomal protein S17E